MRPLTTAFAFAALAAGFILLDRVTAPPGDAGQTPSAADALRVAEALVTRAGLAVGSIVLALPTDGERDFRGLHSAEGRLRPVYGRVRTICTGRAVDPSCWEISYLEIDGSPVAHKITALETRVEPPTEDDDETIETADTRRTTPEPLAREEAQSAPTAVTGRSAVEPPSGGLPEPEVAAEVPELALTGPGHTATGEVPLPAARPEPAIADRHTPEAAVAGGDISDPADEPTHTVDRPVINVRIGPSTDKPIVARLPMGMRLSLIERQQDWGLFRVLDGAATGREVWAALQIVKPLP